MSGEMSLFICIARSVGGRQMGEKSCAAMQVAGWRRREEQDDGRACGAASAPICNSMWALLLLSRTLTGIADGVTAGGVRAGARAHSPPQSCTQKSLHPCEWVC